MRLIQAQKADPVMMFRPNLLQFAFVAFVLLLATLAPSECALGQGISLLPSTQPAPYSAPPSGPAEMIPAPEPQNGPLPVADETLLPSETFLNESHWTPWLGWDGAMELGLSGNSGNSESLSVRAGFNVSRKTEYNKLGLDIAYNYAATNGVEIKHNALMNLTDDVTLGQSRWTLFGKMGLEYDEFKAFDLRFSTSGGVGFRFIKNDVATLTGRFGAGASREFGGPDDDWAPEAVFGFDYEHQLTKMQKFTAKVDYLPEWTDFERYRVASEFAWVMALDAPKNLSLKLSVTDQYDSTPNGLDPNDINYSLLLLWKF